MEAMWTRFLPTIKEFKKVAEDGRLGDPVVMWADLLEDFNINSWSFTECFEKLTLSVRRYSEDTQDIGSDAGRWRIVGSVSIQPSVQTRSLTIRLHLQI
jgi:hypothetical protein